MKILNYIRFVLTSLLLFNTVFVFSQYPAIGSKLRLGYQTTGDGLVYRGAIGDTATLDPSSVNNAWMLLDTANGNLYAYRAKAWQLVSGGGGGGLTMPFNSVTFNVNETDASERELQYSEEKGYLQYGGLDSVQIPLLPGIWYVRNDTNVTIPKGTVVRATGTLGTSGRIKVKHMIANGTIDAMYVLGIAMQDIAVGADGYVMTQGKIRKINTQAYSEGAVLYADVDTFGGLTQTEPTGSNLKLPIAFVVHSASNGTLAVRVSPGTYLRDLHDVYITSPDSSASLYYNTSESVWRDTTAAALKSDISGTTNYLAKFTGSNAVGNSGVFESGGNVGIGTSDPASFGSSQLAVVKAASRSAYNTWLYSNSASNVDASILRVGGSGQWVDGKEESIDLGFSRISSYYKQGAGGGWGLKFKTYTASDFATNESTVTIDPIGNVGIATTTPAYRLDVDGDVNTTGMYKKSGTDIISGTTNYIPKFTGANTIGNSGFIENGQEVYLGGTTNAFNFSRFSIYYNPRNNGFPIVSDTRNYATYTDAGDLITPSGGWSFGGKYNSSDELTAFASIQGKKEDLTESRKGSMIFSTNDDTPGDLFPKERMRITSAGNVGINTTTPAYRLDVDGDVNTTGMYKKSGTDIISGTTNRLAMFTGANTVGNSNAFQDANGNIGVGATPSGTAQILDLYRASASLYPLLRGNSTAQDYAWTFSDGTNTAYAGMMGGTVTGSIGTGGYSIYLPSGSGSPITFSTNATERMRITSAGIVAMLNSNVGIGTASPGYKLSVAKYTSGTTQGEIVQSIIGNTVYSTVGQWAGLSLGTYADKVGIFAYDGYNNFGRNDLVFAVASGGDTNPVTLTDEKMRILNNGNVGIATASPSRPLHVNANSSMIIPSGETGTRPAPGANGDIRYNTTNANFEWYSSAGWREPVNAARKPADFTANRFSKFNADGLLDTSAVLVQANGRIGIWNTPAASDSVLTVTGGIYTTSGVRVNNGVSNFSLTPSVPIPGEITTLGLTHTATSAGDSPGGISAIALTAQTPSTSFTYGTQGGQGINAARIRAFHNASSTLVQLNGVNLTARNLGSGTVTLANGGNFVVGNSGGSATGLITNARGGTFTLENSSSATITNLYGAYFILINANNTAGSIGNIYGTYLEPITGGNPATVSVTNLYGYYIPSGWSAKATNKWSFYANDANAPLYSAGKIGAGVTTPKNALDVEGGAVIGATYSGTNTAPPNGLLVEGETYIGTTTDNGSYNLQVGGNIKATGNISRKSAIVTTSNYTVLDEDTWITCVGTNRITLTLPSASTWPGREIVVQTGTAFGVVSNSSNVYETSSEYSIPDTSIIKADYPYAWAKLVSDGTGWIKIQRSPYIITKSITLDFPAVAAQSSFTFSTTSVGGASIGDVVSIGVPSGMPANTIFTGQVSTTAGTVDIKMHNYGTTTTANPPSATFKIAITKF